MKLKSIIMTVVLLALVIIIVCLCIKSGTNNQKNPSQGQTTQVLEFSLSNYWSKVFDFHYEANVGPITTPEIAIEKAKMVWKEKYGKLYEDNNCPLVVAFDEENECWLVKETLEDENVVGAVPQILIKADGRVLAVWFG